MAGPDEKARCGALDQPPGYRSGSSREGRLTEAPDLIEPPAAREPAEVLLLACAALTDGDLEAAVALYEPDAALSWGQNHDAAGHTAIRQVLATVMDMRLPLRARGVRVLRAGPLALITGERTISGTGLDGVAVTMTGPAALIARCQPDGTWLTAADQWQPLEQARAAPSVWPVSVAGLEPPPS
jgi:ketosteroid isomerase-like protein